MHTQTAALRINDSPFERMADRYDAWFESGKGRPLFRMELECIRDLLKGKPRPWLEIGVGTGRFAQALDIDDGIDPSPAVLRYASQRGIKIRIGKAEKLPYQNHRFGAVLLIVTICFLNNPARALAECHRVLKRNGSVIIGLVPQDSPWGKYYLRKKDAGHDFYSPAKFYTVKKVIELTEEAGLYFNRANSCLFEAPGKSVYSYRPPKAGIFKQAGFVGLLFEKTRRDKQSKP